MAIFRILIFPGILLFVVSLSACQQTSQYDNKSNPHSPLPTGQAGPFSKGGMGGFAGEKKLKVLTTIAPLYCFTKNIAGDLAEVENLLPSGINPHEYSASPADVKKISEAQVLIKNGVNLELWLDKLIASAGRKKLTVVDSSLGVELIGNDPHIWLSPKNAIIQAENIGVALAKADPDNSRKYMENTGEYIRQLNILDEEITNEIKTWKHKEFVAFHSAFLYFEKDYGLRQVAVIQESPEKGPAPKHIANVINIIRAKNIKAIFTEPQASHKIIESISQDLKLQVYTLDNLETGIPYPGWYENRMRANLLAFKKALSGETK